MGNNGHWIHQFFTKIEVIDIPRCITSRTIVYKQNPFNSHAKQRPKTICRCFLSNNSNKINVEYLIRFHAIDFYRTMRVKESERNEIRWWIGCLVNFEIAFGTINTHQSLPVAVTCKKLFTFFCALRLKLSTSSVHKPRKPINFWIDNSKYEKRLKTKRNEKKINRWKWRTCMCLSQQQKKTVNKCWMCCTAMCLVNGSFNTQTFLCLHFMLLFSSFVMVNQIERRKLRAIKLLSDRILYPRPHIWSN